MHGRLVSPPYASVVKACVDAPVALKELDEPEEPDEPEVCSVMAAVAVLVLSAALVTVTITICCNVTDAGATYSPLVETLPTDGLIDHVTPVLLEPATVAVNC